MSRCKFRRLFWLEGSSNISAATSDFQQCGIYDLQSLRSACAYAQSDQSLCKSLEYSMTVKLLTEHHLRFLSKKEAAQARLSLHLSKCHIVGNHISRLINIHMVQYSPSPDVYLSQGLEIRMCVVLYNSTSGLQIMVTL